MSADGSAVVFVSSATDLVAGQSDTGGTSDVFSYDRATAGLRLVSHVPSSPTTAGNAASALPSVSADGRFVAFSSGATDLVAGLVDGNGTSPLLDDVYLADRETGAVTLVSHAAGSTTTMADRGGLQPNVSADGAWVGFSSPPTTWWPASSIPLAGTRAAARPCSSGSGPRAATSSRRTWRAAR